MSEDMNHTVDTFRTPQNMLIITSCQQQFEELNKKRKPSLECVKSNI